jgi:multicomponent Na+:H+ antiporter subunit E
MIRFVSLIVALFVFWLLLSGFFTPFLLSAGIGCAVIVAWYAARRLDVVDHEGHPAHLARAALVYWPWLLWEIAKAAWDVTKRILARRMPISPVMIRVRATQASDLGRVIYANSITLTPGTITMAVEGETFLVHALTREGADGVASGDMDRRVTEFEGTAR